MLDPDQAMLLVLDVQGTLAEQMHDREALFTALRVLLQGCRPLGLPVLVTEQNPDRLGPTRPEIADLVADVERVPKLSFSACGEPRVLEAVAALGRRQVLLAGIEAHICVAQTAADLVAAGHAAEVVADAVASRTERNRDIGLAKAQAAGAALTSVEAALFELLRSADAPQFKTILKLVK